MEKTNRLLYVVIILLGFNLIIGMFSIVVNLIDIKPKQSNSIVKLESTDEAVVSEIAENIIVFYNQKDSMAIHKMFGPEAKAKIKYEQTKSIVESLSSLTGKIKSFQYKESKLLGQSNGNLVTDHFFEIELESQKDAKGTLKVTILDNEGEFQLHGFHINVI